MEKEVDKRGISVCSVHGTDFMPYVKLLGSQSLDIPHVIITDGDPSINKRDEKIYLGNARGIKIAIFKQPGVEDEMIQMFEKHEWTDIDNRLEDFGIFIGESTLELDICGTGYKGEFLDTIKELGAKKTKQKRFVQSMENIDLDNLSHDDSKYVLNTISSYGKGRFAQRLTPKLRSDRIPEYIINAINEITDQVTNE